jgi:hypothetical protein
LSSESSKGLVALLSSTDGAATPRVGVVAGWDPERGLLVEYPGSPGAAMPAQSIVALDAAGIEEAVRSRRAVVLLFDGGDISRPILIGLVEPVNPTPLLDLMMESASSASEVSDAPLPLPQLEAKVDGKRVVVDAEDEIELRCGKASITLRRNGRVIIRGAYVETHAEGVNRIKGGSVAIN